MTQTVDVPGGSARPTWRERAVVLGGFAVAALYTGASALVGTGIESAGAVWLAAIAWAVVTSLACALGRGIRRGDWRAFRRSAFPDTADTLDWSTKTGAWLDMAIAEEHERLMRRD